MYLYVCAIRRIYVRSTYSFGVVFGSKEELWSAVPKGDHHWVKIGHWLERSVEEASKTHVS